MAGHVYLLADFPVASIIDLQLDAISDFHIFEMHYQVHMYVDSREKVTARYQVISVMMNNTLIFWCFMTFYHFD